MWLPKDGFLVIFGTLAMLVNLWLGLRNKEYCLGLLVAGAMAFGMAFYLARGSVLLDFYVIPIIPIYALNIGLMADYVKQRAPGRAIRSFVPVLAGGLAA